MSDLISKDVAIDMLKAVRDLVWDVDTPSPTVPEYIEQHEQMQSIMRNIDVLTDKIIKMPSAQPERKTGRWIDAVIPNDNGGLPVQVCDQCNTFFPLAYTGGGHRFCPNCGCKMEVEHE